MADRLGVDRIVVTHIVPWRENQRRQSLVYHQELCNQMLKKAKLLAKRLYIRLDLPELFNADNRQGSSVRQQRRPTSACYHPWRSFSVNEKGDIMPCCATSVVMGSLERSSFHEIWNGRKYQKLRKTVNSSRPLVFCQDCAFRGIDIESNEPISFCSEQRLLLAAIGAENHQESSSLALREILKRLKRSAWGARALPYLTEFYRRHGAFYVADFYDNWIAPLAERISREK